MKAILSNLIDLNESVGKESGWVHTTYNKVYSSWFNGKFKESPFHFISNFEKYILREINGKKVDSCFERAAIFRQAQGGLWYVDIIKNRGGQVLVKTPFPKSFGEAGCIAFLMLRGYRYSE